MPKSAQYFWKRLVTVFEIFLNLIVDLFGRETIYHSPVHFLKRVHHLVGRSFNDAFLELLINVFLYVCLIQNV